MKKQTCLEKRKQTDIGEHQSISKQRIHMSHAQTIGLLSQGLDWLGRSVMRTGYILLTRRAKLGALSFVIRWFMKQQGNQPLHISHESGYGDLSLMSDGDLIQLTWRLISEQQAQATDSQSTSEMPDVASDEKPVERQSNPQRLTTDDWESLLNERWSEPSHEPWPNPEVSQAKTKIKQNGVPDPVSNPASAKTPDLHAQ